MISRLLIAALLRQLMDPVTRQRIVELVDAVADADMSGEQKRAHVLSQLREWGVTTASWLINLAIELLVAQHRV